MRRAGIWIATLVLLAALNGNAAAAAAPLEQPVLQEIERSDGASILNTDVIIKKYRYYKGKKQYRRWNKSKSKWVDSKWRDC